MNKIECLNLVVNLDEKVCELNGEDVKLSKTEFSLLVFLISNKDKIYSQKELIEYVWPSDTKVTHRAVDTAISRLRRKLGDFGKHIITRLGFGYGFKE